MYEHRQAALQRRAFAVTSSSVKPQPRTVSGKQVSGIAMPDDVSRSENCFYVFVVQKMGVFPLYSLSFVLQTPKLHHDTYYNCFCACAATGTCSADDCSYCSTEGACSSAGACQWDATAGYCLAVCSPSSCESCRSEQECGQDCQWLEASGGLCMPGA